MLVSFSVKNFRSIKELLILDMRADKSLKNDIEQNTIYIEKYSLSLLKSLLIYGANAAGKSNILMGMRQFADIILNTDKEYILPYTPYLLDNESKNNPTYYCIEFIFDNIIYEYTISFNGKMILEESLSFYPEKRKKRLYRREQQKYSFGDDFRVQDRHFFARSTLPNNLYLTNVATGNNELFAKTREFLINMLGNHVSFQDDPIIAPLTTRITSKFNEFDNKKIFKKFMIKSLRAADLGITDYDVKVSEDNINHPIYAEMDDDFKRRFFWDALFAHPKYSDNNQIIGTEYFTAKEESAGTRKMYEFAGEIFYSFMFGRNFITDEMDSSFHPMMSRLIIELFHSDKPNITKAQLIATTHDSSLISTKLMRRDQIIFTEKDKFTGTHIFRLSDFDKNKVRSGQDYAQAYLNGYFGAIPSINSFIVEDALNETENK